MTHMASSTLELVEKLKAQLAESREDLFRKDRLHESTEAKGTPKDLSTLIAGSDSESFSDLRERPPIEYQEEMASMKQEMTAKMHSLASNTRQLSQQLLREREDRLAFQQEVCQRLDDLVQNELHQRPKAHADLLESSVVALRDDLEHLSGQFLLLQQELKASFDSMAMQLGAVVSWVQEKLETQPFTKDGMCLSPIMEDQESPGEPDVIPKEPGPEQVTAVDLQMRDGKMFQVLRNIADEMPAIVKQMAEKTQVLVTRVDHEHAERLAREAHVEEALSTLSRKVEDALSAAGRGWLVDDRDDRDATRPGLPVNRPRTAAPVLLSSSQVRRRLNGCLKVSPDLNFEVQSGVPTPWPRNMLMEKAVAQAP